MMANHEEQVEQLADGRSTAIDPIRQPGDRLNFARLRLARLEAAQKVCSNHRNDSTSMVGELQKLELTKYELSELLELLRLSRSLPEFLKSEIERQKQYVNYLSTRVKPAESHASAVEQEHQREDERAL